MGFRLSSKGFILLVGVSFCIKAMAQRQIDPNCTDIIGTFLIFVEFFFGR